MKQVISFRFDEQTLAAARVKAERQNRSLTNYVETIVRRDLGLLSDEAGGEGFIIWTPDDLDPQDYALVREDGESEEAYRERQALMALILDAGGR